MIGGGEGLGVVAGCGAVAEAVGVVAEVGATFGDMEDREWVGLVLGPFSVVEEVANHGLADALGGGLFGFEVDVVGVRAVEVLAMFPDVSGDVVESVGVGIVAFDGGGAFVAIDPGVVIGKVPGEDVGRPFVFVWLEFVAPGVGLLVESTAGGALPFGFGGEAFSGPFGVGLGVFPCDADDGVVVFVLDVGIGSEGVFPVGAFDKLPPLPFGALLVEFDFLGRG